MRAWVVVVHSAARHLERVTGLSAWHFITFTSSETDGRTAWRLSVIASALLVGCLAVFAVSTVVVDVVVEKQQAASEADAFGLMQRAADHLADEARNLLTTLDETGRMSSLIIRLSQSGDEAGRLEAVDALTFAMQHLRLRPTAIEVRDAANAVVLRIGQEPSGSLDDRASTGLGRPWPTGAGDLAEHYWTSLTDRPDLRMRITFDPLKLSEEISNAMPVSVTAKTPSVSTLVRLEDGVLAARSERASTLLAQQQRISDESLAQMRGGDRGTRRFVSTITDADTIVAFRNIPELGLAAVMSSRTSDLLAVAQLQAKLYRRVPWAVLLGSLCLATSWLVLITRARAKAVVDRERRLVEASQAARAELEHLVKCSPALLYRGKIDREGLYSRDFVTPNAKAITGWEPEMLSDPERVWRMSSEEDRHLRGTNYARALREGRSAVEYRFLRPDGGFSWLRNEAVITLRNPDGSAEVAGAITNITREREMAAFAAMQNRMATLGQIATSLAHELTQPVTVIGMAAAIAQSLASEGNASADLRAQIDAILVQTDRAGEMIHHLRSYGHADGGPLTGIHLAQAVAGALTLAGTALREAGVVVDIDVPDRLPPVRARLVQVEQVLVNLMLNARDAMRVIPAGERRLRIHATVGDLIRMHVTDSGPGIAADVIPRLFEAFYTTKQPGEGTGLGLALCGTMMRGFGGAITVGRTSGGAEFILEFLPFARAGSPGGAPASACEADQVLAERS